MRTPSPRTARSGYMDGGVGLLILFLWAVCCTEACNLKHRMRFRPHKNFIFSNKKYIDEKLDIE